jgi:hypothetical protein
MSPIALESCPTVDVPGRTFIATEPTERFFAYGRLILAPAAGMVVETDYREVDHVGRRSQLTLVRYALGQAAHTVVLLPGVASDVKNTEIGLSAAEDQRS